MGGNGLARDLQKIAFWRSGKSPGFGAVSGAAKALPTNVLTKIEQSRLRECQNSDI